MKKTNKNVFEQVIDQLSCLRYLPGFNIDYDTHYACRNGSSCCDNDMCRCGVISNASVSIDYSEFIQALIPKEASEIEKYCIDRVCKCLQLDSKFNWTPNVHGGYYGEEVSGASLDSSIEQATRAIFTELAAADDLDKIKIVLKAEYGFVLQDLEKCSSVSVQNVPLSLVLLNNKDYSRKVNRLVVQQYANCPSARAVVLLDGSYFRVIDGYHRVTAAMNAKLETIPVVVMGW